MGAGRGGGPIAASLFPRKIPARLNVIKKIREKSQFGKIRYSCIK